MTNLVENERFERRAIVAALSLLCDPLRTMENIALGDTVKLKSGGPTMTAGKASNQTGDQISCTWFEGDAVRHGTFYLAQLVKAEPEKEWHGEGLDSRR